MHVVVRSKGLTVFARIDHSGEAERAGLKMRPTQLLICGNHKTGTPLMIANPSVAIGLPTKALGGEEGNRWAGLRDRDPA